MWLLKVTKQLLFEHQEPCSLCCCCYKSDNSECLATWCCRLLSFEWHICQTVRLSAFWLDTLFSSNSECQPPCYSWRADPAWQAKRQKFTLGEKIFLFFFHLVFKWLFTQWCIGSHVSVLIVKNRWLSKFYDVRKKNESCWTKVSRDPDGSYWRKVFHQYSRCQRRESDTRQRL